MVISMILHPHKFPRYYTTTYPGMLNCTGTSFSLLRLGWATEYFKNNRGMTHPIVPIQRRTCKSQRHEQMMNMLEIITHRAMHKHYAMVHNVCEK